MMVFFDLLSRRSWVRVSTLLFILLLDSQKLIQQPTTGLAGSLSMFDTKLESFYYESGQCG